MQTNHILLVEDDPINQLVLKGFLQSKNIQVEIANNGKEALEKLKNEPVNNPNPYKLIFMDALMPEMDGYEATRKIRAGEARENNQNIIIIGFTANAMESNKNKSLALGMNDHITKPIDHKKLTKILDKWLIKIN